jgi:hypothetical protein
MKYLVPLLDDFLPMYLLFSISNQLFKLINVTALDVEPLVNCQFLKYLLLPTVSNEETETRVT